MFGLSQLYQMRGRVGRSDVAAYTYLLYPPGHQLSNEAKRRLKAMRELSHLGSGFELANRDLEIRGAGNIFGTDQVQQSVPMYVFCSPPVPLPPLAPGGVIVCVCDVCVCVSFPIYLEVSFVVCFFWYNIVCRAGVGCPPSIRGVSLQLGVCGGMIEGRLITSLRRRKAL